MLLSVAMMVKNEAANLRRCLESIKPLSAELIIVDTGSTDATISIASEYGARIYNHPWQQDFALHRQQSFDYCNGDWIFQIDADEELVIPPAFNVQHLRRFLSSQVDDKFDQVGLNMHDMRDNGKRKACDMQMVRIFRKGSVKWKYCVHNYPQTRNNHEAAYCPFIMLKHYGYDLTPEQQAAKARRTIPLLHKRLDQDKKDWDAYYYLMHAYASYANDEEKAIKYGEKYVRKIDNISPKSFNNTAFYTMFKLHQKHGNRTRAEELLKIGLGRMPYDVDITYGLMEYGLWIGDNRVITAGAERYLHSYKKFRDEQGLVQNGMHTFNFTDRSFAMATYQLLLSRMQGTTFLYRQLNEALKKVDPVYAEKTREFLQANQKKLGVEICQPSPSSQEPVNAQKPSGVIRRLFQPKQTRTASI